LPALQQIHLASGDSPFVWPSNRHEPGDEEADIMGWVRAALWAALGLAASFLFVWWLL